MSRRTISATDSGNVLPQKRSWVKTFFAFFPFLALVIGAWTYAIHLDTIASQSMVRSKSYSKQQQQQQQSSSQQQQQQNDTPDSSLTKDDVVIGDSRDNIFYFIQVSDLHISRYRKASTANFYTFLSSALPFIDPAFVVVTGDVTDAKDINLSGSMQYMDEWITYRDALEESGVLTKRNGTFWHDLRGNHDCFDVPAWNSKENVFAEMSATRTPGFMFDVKTDYGKYGFVGIDACTKPGPARPYNFFGLFETPDMDNLKQRLDLTRDNNHTFVFSHYPVTTTMFGETSEGESFAELSKAFSVYMCGHLHTLKWGLGDALKSYQPSHFLELEVGDMKQHGIYRIMTVDHDMISFTDVSMPMTTIPSALIPSPKRNESAEQQQQEEEDNNNTETGKDGRKQSDEKGKRRPALGPRLPTNPVIVVSNPKDSRYLIPKHEPVDRIGKSTHIRFLAWTDNQIPDGDHDYVRQDVKIEIKIDGELHQNPCRFAGTPQNNQTVDHDFLPLYVSEWNPQDYNDGTEHEIEIKIVDRFGRVGSHTTVFRVDGERTKMKGGFGEWIMWSNIAVLLKALFTTGYLAVSLLLLVIPKLFSLYLQTSPPPLPSSSTSSKSVESHVSSHTEQIRFKNGYDAWLNKKCLHLFQLSSTLSNSSRWNRFVNHTIHAHILRFVHFSTQPILFYSTLIFTLMLVTAPHYRGDFIPAAGEQGQGYFYLQGIYLPNAYGGHLGGGLGAASLDPAGAERVHQPLKAFSYAVSSMTGGRLLSSYATAPQQQRTSAYNDVAVGGTWIPMADTWMSTIWTVIYDLVIFLYYLTLCATPSGYLYSTSNPHRLRPYHRTWYIRSIMFGIWVYRCFAVVITAELYGPSVIWTGIGTWWLLIVGWLMFTVGWSKSRVERDILQRRGDDDSMDSVYDKDSRVEDIAVIGTENVGLLNRKDVKNIGDEDDDDDVDVEGVDGDDK
ncbi:Transmembrane protein 62 [Entomortierella beljakovae]|nr:Transmembrane protein 62 [Entomortierella beljakovae]